MERDYGMLADDGVISSWERTFLMFDTDVGVFRNGHVFREHA